MRAVLLMIGTLVPGWALAERAWTPSFALQQYRLRNGLDVVLHPDQRQSKVVVNVLYRVGSADEASSRTGIAHLFEHLMFMGTQRVPEGQIDALMERYGGWNNAYTTEDVTMYYDVGPARLLETLLWVEADRMATLAQALDAAKLDLQRKVVLNEWRQSYQNAPYGVGELALPQLAFPAKHPYSWPVIGDPDDLRAVGVSELKAWFHRYYCPGNASLVVAGRFDVSRVREAVQHYFSWIPRCSARKRSGGSGAAKRRCKESRTNNVCRFSFEAPGWLGARRAHILHMQPTSNDASRDGSGENCKGHFGATTQAVARETLRDDVEMPKVWLAWRSPAAFTKGDAAMDLLASVLTVGKSSRLHRVLVHDRRLAQSVTSYQDSRRLGGLFVVEVTVRVGLEPKVVEAATRQVLGRLRREGVAPVELERARNRHVAEFIESLQDVRTRAESLNHYLAYVGKANCFGPDLQRYISLSPEQLTQVARQVVGADRGAVLWVMPRAR